MKNPSRNLLFPDKVSDYFRHERGKADFNFATHEQLHKPSVATFNSATTLDNDPGALTYPPRPGQLVRCRANVQSAPTTGLTWRILRNGTSIMQADSTIDAGEVVGPFVEFIENSYFTTGDYFQVEITDFDDAVGPLIMHVEWIPTDMV